MAYRSNLWSFLIYPRDSAPDNYLNMCSSWHIPILLSPVHLPDPDGDEDEKYKDHVHVMILFSSLKSLDQVKVYSDQLHGTRPFIVHSSGGLIRYFIHRDNPEKPQYNIDDLVSFSGFEYLSAFDTVFNSKKCYSVLENLILTYQFHNLIDLYQFLISNNMTEYLEFLRTHTYWIKALLDGMYQLKGSNKKSLTFESD